MARGSALSSSFCCAMRVALPSPSPFFQPAAPQRQGSSLSSQAPRWSGSGVRTGRGLPRSGVSLLLTGTTLISFMLAMVSRGRSCRQRRPLPPSSSLLLLTLPLSSGRGLRVRARLLGGVARARGQGRGRGGSLPLLHLSHFLSLLPLQATSSHTRLVGLKVLRSLPWDRRPALGGTRGGVGLSSTPPWLATLRR